MKSTFSRITLLGLAATLSSSAALAAAGEVPLDFRPIRRNTFSFGFNVRNFGPNVRFSNLGSIPLSAAKFAADGTRLAPAGNLAYSNGTLNADSRRVFEQQANIDAGFTDLTPAGRFTVYQTRTPVVGGAEELHRDANGNRVRIGEGLSFVDGQTRTWSTNTEAQISGSQVAFSDYGIETDRASIQAESGNSSGVELSFERTMSKPNSRFQWGFGGSIGIADINAKIRGNITSTLVRRTDNFLRNNAAPGNAINLTGDPNARYTTANQLPVTGTYDDVLPNGVRFTQSGTFVNVFGQIVNVTGQLLNSSGSLVDPSSSDPALRDPVPFVSTPENPLVTRSINSETAVPLFNNAPDSSEEVRQAGAANVEGFWQIKGSYYSLKLGPNFRYKLNDRFAIAGRAGVSVNYIGSRFIVEERVTNAPSGVNSLVFNSSNPDGFADINAALAGEPTSTENETTKITYGGYVGLDVEYWVSDRTGFYAGMTYENLGSYNQTFRGRVAEIGSASGTSMRFGVITRF